MFILIFSSIMSISLLCLHFILRVRFRRTLEKILINELDRNTLYDLRNHLLSQVREGKINPKDKGFIHKYRFLTQQIQKCDDIAAKSLQ